jgi:hypothetical protein
MGRAASKAQRDAAIQLFIFLDHYAANVARDDIDFKCF